jgi:glycosyltransferase involved in cell wall biosynthesis
MATAEQSHRAAPPASPLRIVPATPIPGPIAVGGGTTLFLDGCCSHPSQSIDRLDALVGEREHRALGWEMPPPGSLRGGDYFWVIVPIEPIDAPRVERVRLRARLRDGTVLVGELGAVELVPDLGPPPQLPEPPVAAGGPAEPLVAICMATHEPPIELFQRQIESIRAQSHRRWVCVISDDASSSESVRGIEAVLAGDRRFALSRSPRRLGVYSNFERALTMAPPEAGHIALCDQDDRWHGGKLRTLLSRLEAGSELVYSDMRVVDEDGELISDTYWSFRRNNHTDFASLVVANTVTGAASLFRRSLLDDALPFPPPQGPAYHDHWIAQVAMALGEIDYVDEPLYDYVQHRAAALGHAGANAFGRHGPPTPARIRARVERLRQSGFHTGWRAQYFDLYCRVAIAARTLEMRCGERMTRSKRRALARIEDSGRAGAWLLARSTRPVFGADETLGRERAMFLGLAWRRFVAARKRLRNLRDRRRGDDRGRSIEAAATGGRAPHGGRGWLTPILVDYFTRDGSTLMMRLLASSPEVAVEDVYPYERKYFAYLLQWSQLLDRPDWPEDEWGAASLGSLSQLQTRALVGPPPWRPRELIDSDPAEESMSRRCFELAWAEFSRRAARASSGEGPRPRYYAEKHLNTWLVDRVQLPRVEVIALLRDPRDTWVSINAFNTRRGTGALGLDRAASSERHLEQVIARQRERLRWIASLLEDGSSPVVAYSDLVLDTEAVARRLGSWLGVQLDPRAARGDRRMASRHVSAETPEASVGRWRTELEPAVAERFRAELGPELRAVGLEP